MKNALPHHYQAARAFETVCLRMREAAVHGDMGRDARVLMADLAAGTKLISRALFSSEFASERAYPAMVEICRLLGVVGEDLEAYFIRANAEPLTPRELEIMDMDARSERTREEMRG
jgi:hypothetical protein